MNVVRNQNGGVTMIMATLTVGVMIASYYVSMQYVSAKAKLSQRISEYYRLLSVYEEAAKIVRLARDLSANPLAMNWPAPNPACANICQAATGAAPTFCIPHELKPSIPYCFHIANIKVRNANVDLRLIRPQDSVPDLNPLEETLIAFSDQKSNFERAVREFEFLPQAKAVVAGMRMDNGAPAPTNCDAGTANPGCIACGGINPYGLDPVTCVTVSTCPLQFSRCQGTTNPLTTQTIFLLPKGYAR